MTKDYIGTKIVTAWHETRDGKDGYAVKYSDGYISWSPKDIFEEAYRETSGIPFGLAIEAMKKGMRVARAGWNGKGMWLAMVTGSNWGIGGTAPYDYPDAPHVAHLDFIGMKTADNKFVPWLASQTDMLADDWSIVNS
ncbi:DUF2829 domain-containing protein [Burkholderia cepacia]|uniref:DUF2829 domain-containing protein n=1 Tax=Burkholderia cepacia TaxID=292 RepID=UPI001F3F6C66|nr:DUF2829 domain-containing protein [Burkholderia cepacia]UIY58103.1 DUF2829 domain-containing protein [Burkholderia cepacia]